MPREYLDAVCQKDQTVNPLFTFLGAELLRAERGEAEIHMPVSGNICQGGGLVAGGVLATLADEVMAHAVLSVLLPGQKAVTTEMNIRFLRAANPKEQKKITARARVVKKGRHLFVAEAVVEDTEKKQLALAGGTFFVITPEPSLA